MNFIFHIIHGMSSFPLTFIFFKMVVVQINIISVIRYSKDIPLEIGRFSPGAWQVPLVSAMPSMLTSQGPGGKMKGAQIWERARFLG